MVAGSDLSRFSRDEGGATAIEYALLAALIGVAMAAAAGAAGQQIWALLNTIASAL